MNEKKPRNKIVRNANIKIKKDCIQNGTKPTHMWCSRCNTLKSLNEMTNTKDPSNFFGHLASCNQCNAKHMRQYKEKNRDEINKRNRELYPSRKDKMLRKQKIYTHSEEFKKKRRENLKKKYREDPAYRIKLSLRGRLLRVAKSGRIIKRRAVSYGIDWNLSVTHLGPVPDTINRWSIDHIIPCDAFDMDNDRHVYLCFHYTNLRWLNFDKNTAKGNKIIPKLILSYNLQEMCDEIGLNLEKYTSNDNFYEEFK